MSRHRSAYNDEDLYDYDDYDDYDDYYEEEYEQSNYQAQGTHAPASSLTIDLVSAERESAVSFIMETLGGTNFTKQQVSDAYKELGGNTTEVIDHLLHMQTVQMEVDEQERENEATAATKSAVTATNNTAAAASASKGSPVTPTRRDRSNSIGKSKSLTALSPTSAMRVQKHKAATFQEMGTKGSLGSKSAEKDSSSSSGSGSSSKGATPQSHAKPPLAPVSGGSKLQRQQDKDSKSHSMVQSNAAMKAERERQQQQRVKGGGDKDDRDPLSYQPDKLAYVPQRVAPGQSKQAIDMSLMGFDSESHNSLAELDHPLSPRRRGSGIYGDDDGDDDYDVGPPISLRPVMSSPDMADMIGAGSGPGSLKPIPLSRSPSAILLTSNAVLSDEEWEDEGAMGGTQSKQNVQAWHGLKSATGGETTSSTTALEEKSHMTLIVAGHVDAGKSTLLGNLLYKAKLVSQRSIHKFAKESQQIGKGSFALAWVMDGSASEREHGVTIDIAEKILTTESKVLTVLDAPGHRDFIPNMISGATFADCALLVIPASPGEYEKAMGPGAQTKEHAILLKALGVNQVLVAVNKMDMTLPEPWSQQRFEVVKTEVMQMLVQLQFKGTNIRFVPVSGLAGGNLVKEDDPEGLLKNLRAWYDGPCLLEALDTLRPPVRHTKKPLRAIVTSVVAEKDRGVIVRASIVQGTMRAQRGVGLTTCNGCATVKSIIEEESGSPLSMARAGDKGVVLTLSDRSGRSGEEMSMRSGVVLCKGPPLPPLATKFKASILTMPDITPPVIPGTSYYMYLHGQELLCVVKKIHSMTITTTVLPGKDDGTATFSTSSSAGAAATGGYTTVVKKHPKCVAGGRSAVVTIEVERPVCIEPFTECKSLGRFALRATGGTCAVGVCDKVYSDDKDSVAKAFQF